MSRVEVYRGRFERDFLMFVTLDPLASHKDLILQGPQTYPSFGPFCVNEVAWSLNMVPYLLKGL